MKNKILSEHFNGFSCSSCGCNDIKDEWSYKGGDSDISVLWCNNCDLGRLNPFPTIEKLRQLYSRKPVYGLHYRNESHGGFPIRVKRLSELIPKKGRLLDIGSGLGYFLKIAQNDGWDVEGIEPRSDAAKYCYEKFGIRVYEGFLENFECQPGVYDVITLWDVLEHVSDHIRFIERSIELLAPGGILVLAIPNASGWPARLFRGRWRYVMPTHLHYFKMPYITRMLSNKKIYIERADHTVKIHSVIQGLISLLPFKVNEGRVFNIGIRNDGKQGNLVKNAVRYRPKESPLNKARKLAFKFNMMTLPGGIGDMVDLYCRSAHG